MNAELERVNTRQRYANNNLAGATLENSLAQEKQNIQDRYQSRIDELNAKLERLRNLRSEARAK